ncbi:MAG: hypothetical protein OM95_05425 [Bdellovibrio sp. ArHS]|uniref:trypsin-like serine peptidase n=1 Tax=Bdellovibrio sp. ArHS TaxID=1569284 RepID=UPI000583796B|nr:serine protease [Bdellovibrio sp. ArHS]KHD88920.1 MAG: hypothetical protein OM95_05425 [Bdellovibrio sp. ArHS]
MTVIFRFVLSFTLMTPLLSHADIFGPDDRKDPLQVPSKSHLANSVAVGVLSSLWTDLGNGFSSLEANRMNEFMCQDERFSEENSIAYACSGFLVAPDLLVTAGHCAVNFGEIHHVTDQYCEVYTWLFDYNSKMNLRKISNDKIYRCKEIIYATLSEAEEVQDFALIRLDRHTVNRTPFKIADHPIQMNDSVALLGFPMGLPLKFADNAKVFSPNHRGRSFLTDLDAFSGNSGGPVLNAKDEVVGLLIAGNPSNSTYTDPVQRCERYNSCDSNGENCKAFSPHFPLQGFPNTFSEVQSLLFYRDVILKSMVLK